MDESRYIVNHFQQKQINQNPTIDFRIGLAYVLPELMPNIGEWWSKGTGYSVGPPAGRWQFF